MLRFHPHSDLASTVSEPAALGIFIAAVVVIVFTLYKMRNSNK